MTITDDIEKIDASPAGLIKRVHPPGLRHTARRRVDDTRDEYPACLREGAYVKVTGSRRVRLTSTRITSARK